MVGVIIAEMYRPTITLTKHDVSLLGGLAILILFVLLATILSYWSPVEDTWSTFATVFLGIFIEAVPFLLLGTLASGLVEVFIGQDILQRFVPDSPALSALFGCLLGLFFPVCECGVVPLVRRLFRKGLPIPAGIAFLLAAPIVNPIVIFSTATAFGFGKMLLMRVGFALLIAFITGIVFTASDNPWEILRPTPWITCESCEEHHHLSHEEHENSKTTVYEKIRQAFLVALDEFFEMGRYLVFGGLIAAGMQVFVHQSLLLDVGKGTLVSVLVMMALAILLSICSTVDSFVALGFVGVFSSGSILAFLLYGPMVDIKSTLMFLRVFKARPVLYLITIPFLLVLLVCVTLNYFYTW